MKEAEKNKESGIGWTKCKNIIFTTFVNSYRYLRRRHQL